MLQASSTTICTTYHSTTTIAVAILLSVQQSQLTRWSAIRNHAPCTPFMIYLILLDSDKNVEYASDIGAIRHMAPKRPINLRPQTEPAAAQQYWNLQSEWQSQCTSQHPHICEILYIHINIWLILHQILKSSINYLTSLQNIPNIWMLSSTNMTSTTALWQ